MTSHDWCWSDIVNPELVEQALAAQRKRRRRVFDTWDDEAPQPAPDKEDRTATA